MNISTQVRLASSLETLFFAQHLKVKLFSKWPAGKRAIRINVMYFVSAAWKNEKTLNTKQLTLDQNSSTNLWK